MNNLPSFDPHYQGNNHPSLKPPPPYPTANPMPINANEAYQQASYSSPPAAASEPTALAWNHYYSLEKANHSLEKANHSLKLWIRISLICLASCIVITGVLGFLYRASNQNQVSQMEAMKSLQGQINVLKKQGTLSSLSQFQQDIQGWPLRTTSLTNNGSLNEVQWKDSDQIPMELGYCHYMANTYRAETKPGKIGNTCTANLNPLQRDIALQVRVLLLQGTEAGIALRWNGSGQNITNYQLIVKKVGLDGAWILRKGIPIVPDKDVLTGNVPGLFKDSGSPTTIGMKADKNNVYLYISGRRVGYYDDPNALGPGTIGLSAGPGTTDKSSEVMFTNADIYTPKL